VSLGTSRVPWLSGGLGVWGPCQAVTFTVPPVLPVHPSRPPTRPQIDRSQAQGFFKNVVGLLAYSAYSDSREIAFLVVIRDHPSQNFGTFREPPSRGRGTKNANHCE